MRRRLSQPENDLQKRSKGRLDHEKILIVTTISATLSGFFGAIARHLRARGWQVDGMAQGASISAECVAAFDRVWDVEWSRNPLDPKNLLRAPDTIGEVIAQVASYPCGESN